MNNQAVSQVCNNMSQTRNSNHSRKHSTQTTTRCMYKIPLILLFTTISATASLAETLYVDDTLRVGIRAKPDKTLPSLVVIKSGTPVELLQKKGGYAKIRTVGGAEGWVKSAYLAKEEPAIRQLARAKQKIKTLETQIQNLTTQQQSQADTENQNLKQQIASLSQEKEALQRQLQAAKNTSRNDTSTETTPATINRSIAIDFKNLSKNMFYLGIGGIIVLLSMGFLFGVSWYKKQVTKRLGGLSI